MLRFGAVPIVQEHAQWCLGVTAQEPPLRCLYAALKAQHVLEAVQFEILPVIGAGTLVSKYSICSSGVGRAKGPLLTHAKNSADMLLWPGAAARGAPPEFATNAREHRR